MLPDRTILIGPKLVKNVEIEKVKCDSLCDFQTLCAPWNLWHTCKTTEIKRVWPLWPQRPLISINARCLKITERVSFNIVSYVYILSGQKFIKNAQKWSFLASFWKLKVCGQIVLPDKSKIRRKCHN